MDVLPDRLQVPFQIGQSGLEEPVHQCGDELPIALQVHHGLGPATGELCSLDQVASEPAEDGVVGLIVEPPGAGPQDLQLPVGEAARRVSVQVLQCGVGEWGVAGDELGGSRRHPVGQ